MKHQSVLNALKRNGLTAKQLTPKRWMVSGERFSLEWFVQGENTSGCLYLNDSDDPNDPMTDYYSSSHWYTIKSGIDAFFRFNELFKKVSSK